MSKVVFGECSWCGQKLDSKRKKYCSHSHAQMSWASRNPDYRHRQQAYWRSRNNKGVRLNTAIQFIQAAQVIENDKEILHI